MLAGTIESLVENIGLNRCCWCVDHRKGVLALGVAYSVVTLVVFGLTLTWSFGAREYCYGPIVVDVDQDCDENLDGGDDGTQLERELIKINDFLTDFKMSFRMFVVIMVVTYMVAVLFSCLLVFGAAKTKKFFLIPWLVMVKVHIVCLLFTTVFIIFLEGRLYTVGSTVFGLFSLLTLAMASLEAYFWLVVQSLYIRLEQREFTMYELQHQRDRNHRHEADTFRSFNGRTNQGFESSVVEDVGGNGTFEVVVLDAGALKVPPLPHEKEAEIKEHVDMVDMNEKGARKRSGTPKEANQNVEVVEVSRL